MKLAFLDKSPTIGLPEAQPFPYNPVTGEQWEAWEQEEINMFIRMRLTRGVVQILGIPRSGKSTLMAWLGFKLRKYFGMQVASDFPLRQAFGDYFYMDDLGFLDELEKMIHIVKAYKQGHENAFAESNSRLYRAAVLWDEAHKGLNKRRSGTGELILKTECCSLWGHYQSLFCFAAPGTNLIEHIRLKDWITHDVSASFDARSGRSIYQIYSRYDMLTWVQVITVADWAPLFDSMMPVAPSVAVLYSTMEKVLKARGVVEKYQGMKETDRLKDVGQVISDYEDLKTTMEKAKHRRKADDDEDPGDEPPDRAGAADSGGDTFGAREGGTVRRTRRRAHGAAGAGAARAPDAD